MEIIKALIEATKINYLEWTVSKSYGTKGIEYSFYRTKPDQNTHVELEIMSNNTLKKEYALKYKLTITAADNRELLKIPYESEAYEILLIELKQEIENASHRKAKQELDQLTVNLRTAIKERQEYNETLYYNGNAPR